MDSCTCSLAFASSTPFSFICASVILETVFRMCAGINFWSLCVFSSSCGGDDDAFAAIIIFFFRPTRRVVRCGRLWELWRLWTFFPTQSMGFAFDQVADRTKPAAEEEDMCSCSISKRVVLLPEEGQK